MNEQMGEKQSLDENKAEIISLTNRVENLEKAIRILDVLAQRYCKQNGIQVQRFVDGLTVITEV